MRVKMIFAVDKGTESGRVMGVPLISKLMQGVKVQSQRSNRCFRQETQEYLKTE